MFNLKKQFDLVQYLKEVSPGMYQDTGSEIVIFCPFCDDATRKLHPSHGHCYFSVNSPVFNCFRCGKSGTVVSFLIALECQDTELIKTIGSFISHNFIKLGKKNIYHGKENTLKYCHKENILFMKQDRVQYTKFKEYVMSRIGEVGYTNFLLYPKVNNNILYCAFNNTENNIITMRTISEAKYRYKKMSDNWYYFQEVDIDKIKNIYITEGPFDLINLYLYGHRSDNSLYVAICGKNYVGSVEKLVINDFLIGEYNINVIFDNDIQKKKMVEFMIRRVTNTYNENINVNAFKPIVGKDVGDNTLLELI